jgi:hypothetical protein
MHRTPSGGDGGYGTPVITPYDDRHRSGAERYHDPLLEHEEYSPAPARHENDLTTAQPYPTPPSHYPGTTATVPYSSRSPPTPPQHQQRREGREGGMDYLFNEKRVGKRDAEFDLLLTPNHTALPHHHQAARIAGASGSGTPKGYYDGLLDIPVVPSVSSSRAAGVTPARDQRSPGGSGKKPVYSWSLPGFGREDELGVPTSAPPSRA